MRFIVGTLSLAIVLTIGTAILVAPSAQTTAAELEPSVISIYFQEEATALTPEAKDLVQEAAARILEKGAEVRLITFTDAATAPSNENASIRQRTFARAHSVMVALIEYGIDSTMIRVVDVPLSDDVASANSNTTFIASRRTDIVIGPGGTNSLSF